MSLKSLQKQYLAIYRNMLIARRNARPDRETKYHQELVVFCEKHDIDFAQAWSDALRWLKSEKNPNLIADSMNGII